MNETKIFDNEKVTKLVEDYKNKGNDPQVLGHIIIECNSLISVIAAKYSSAYILQDDLVQEGRMHVMKGLKEWDSTKNKKLYSYLSVVIRNGIIDYIRKQKPVAELDDLEDETLGVSEGEFTAILAEDMRDWFEDRFPTLISQDKSGVVLQVIIGGMLDKAIGKRKTINMLVKQLKFKANHAKLLYEAVLVRLRTIMENPRNGKKASEFTLQPELQVIVDKDYAKVADAFSGLSVKFNSTKGKQ